jgi:peptidoglycan glycosyltransferase
MFLVLFISTTTIQVFQADDIASDRRNTRAVYESSAAPRGALLVAGQPIAESIPVGDGSTYQCVYPSGPHYSAVTGFFSVDHGSSQLEQTLDNDLSGDSGSRLRTS